MLPHEVAIRLSSVTLSGHGHTTAVRHGHTTAVPGLFALFLRRREKLTSGIEKTSSLTCLNCVVTTTSQTVLTQRQMTRSEAKSDNDSWVTTVTSP